MNCPEDAAFAKNLPDSESYIPTVSFNLATPFESNEPSIFFVKIQILKKVQLKVELK